MYAGRRIRSFVLRAGRLTQAQQRAIQQGWPVFGLETGDPLDFQAIFARPPGQSHAQRCLEIGFGAGEVIGALAEHKPHNDYLGIEVHRAGIGRLIQHGVQAGLKNLRIVCGDAVEVLAQSIPDASFDEVLIFFPDPWHKKRHHKRRLINAGFTALVADKMKTGGILRLSTDWQDYAEQMLDVLSAESRLESMSPDGTYVPRPDFRPLTRFEQRGTRLGHTVRDLAYQKRSG